MNQPVEFVERDLPDHSGRDHIVQWHVFRSEQAARDHIPAIRIGEDQELVCGKTRDSVGDVWWVGVRVRDLTRWGNRAAINKHPQSE